MQDYLYMEEIWPFQKSEDILTDEFGCLRFYSPKPSVYSVIEVRRILRPAPITLDPAHQILTHNAIPRSALEREQNYSYARADTSSGVGDGSAFWILNWWALLWNSQKPCNSGETLFTKRLTQDSILCTRTDTCKSQGSDRMKIQQVNKAECEVSRRQMCDCMSCNFFCPFKKHGAHRRACAWSNSTACHRTHTCQ